MSVLASLPSISSGLSVLAARGGCECVEGETGKLKAKQIIFRLDVGICCLKQFTTLNLVNRQWPVLMSSMLQKLTSTKPDAMRFGSETSAGFAIF
eukprot:g11369.t1